MCNKEKAILSQFREGLEVLIYILVLLIRIFHFASQYPTITLKLKLLWKL